jgi:hypothetical protein
MARDNGVPDAIGRGADPPFAAGDERAVYTVAVQLSRTGCPGSDAYDAAHRFLGGARAWWNWWRYAVSTRSCRSC